MVSAEEACKGIFKFSGQDVESAKTTTGCNFYTINPYGRFVQYSLTNYSSTSLNVCSSTNKYYEEKYCIPSPVPLGPCLNRGNWVYDSFYPYSTCYYLKKDSCSGNFYQVDGAIGYKCDNWKNTGFCDFLPPSLNDDYSKYCLFYCKGLAENCSSQKTRAECENTYEKVNKTIIDRALFYTEDGIIKSCYDIPKPIPEACFKDVELNSVQCLWHDGKCTPDWVNDANKIGGIKCYDPDLDYLESDECPKKGSYSGGWQYKFDAQPALNYAPAKTDILETAQLDINNYDFEKGEPEEVVFTLNTEAAYYDFYSKNLDIYSMAYFLAKKNLNEMLPNVYIPEDSRAFTLSFSTNGSISQNKEDFDNAWTLKKEHLWIKYTFKLTIKKGADQKSLEDLNFIISEVEGYKTMAVSHKSDLGGNYDNVIQELDKTLKTLNDIKQNPYTLVIDETFGIYNFTSRNGDYQVDATPLVPEKPYHRYYLPKTDWNTVKKKIEKDTPLALLNPESIAAGLQLLFSLFTMEAPPQYTPKEDIRMIPVSWQIIDEKVGIESMINKLFEYKSNLGHINLTDTQGTTVFPSTVFSQDLNMNPLRQFLYTKNRCPKHVEKTEFFSFLEPVSAEDVIYYLRA